MDKVAMYAQRVSPTSQLEAEGNGQKKTEARLYQASSDMLSYISALGFH